MDSRADAMSIRPDRALEGEFRLLLDRGTRADLADDRLIACFLTADAPASAAAFSVLVRRHGPVGDGLCRLINFSPKPRWGRTFRQSRT